MKAAAAAAGETPATARKRFGYQRPLAGGLQGAGGGSADCAHAAEPAAAAAAAAAVVAVVVAAALERGRAQQMELHAMLLLLAAAGRDAAKRLIGDQRGPQKGPLTQQQMCR